MKILNSVEQEAFENPPIFNSADRKKFFDIPLGINQIIKALRTPTNKFYFLLSFGYFRATRRFFIRKFHQRDIAFVAARLELDLRKITVNTYEEPAYRRHKKIILDYYGFREFDETAKLAVKREIHSMIRSQSKPKLIFLRVIEILGSQKIEIPTYNALSSLIIEEMKQHKQELTGVIEGALSNETRQMLDALFEKEPEAENIRQSTKVQRYKLTLLKKFNLSTRPKKIKANIEDLQTLKELFYSLEGTIKALNLTYDGITYYAVAVIKTRTFQISRKIDKDRYLHLLSFVVHQFFKLQDLLMDALLTAVQSNIHSANREHKEFLYENRKEKTQSLNQFVSELDKSFLTISIIKDIVDALNLSDSEKIERLRVLIAKDEEQRIKVQKSISIFREESEKILKDTEFYDILEAKSIKLQNRVSEIVKNIEFDSENSSPTLIQAIEYYRKKDGNIDKNAPIDFLNSDEENLIFDNDDKFRVSLYKSLLFFKIAEAIKGGAVNLKYSLKYRSLEEYMISKRYWQMDTKDYLQRTTLTEVTDLKAVLEQLEPVADRRYNTTNRNILSGKNEYIKFKKNGAFTLTTPKAETNDTELLSEFFPKKHYISLLEILHSVDGVCNFLDVFEHWQAKYNRVKPSKKTFLAGIIGYGCNIGINKIAKISFQINEHELENTINWYFSENNVSSANDIILRFMDSLDLPNIYRRDKDLLHTSSDGQKIDVAVESLNAGYSFKYHYMEKGSTACRFLDERNFFFDSIVFSSSEKEAPYVIDGLMHNDIIKSDIHSTDTDGYTDAIFAVTYLLGFTFAPRIKGIAKKLLYSFLKRKYYEELGYKILPEKYINVSLIEDNWDDILRFVATIKLKETTASQLFKRLNSYSKQHVLYQALKEFGKIIKTIFILRYIPS
jgi:hypothetical protein